MAKIILGSRPKSFKRKVSVDLPEGGVGSVSWSFVYRTRTEFGALLDDIFGAAGVAPASQQDADVRVVLKEAFERTRDANADYMMRIADGWDLDAEFSRASVQQLCDEYPGLALKTIDDYRSAITEGRLGN